MLSRQQPTAAPKLGAPGAPRAIGHCLQAQFVHSIASTSGHSSSPLSLDSRTLASATEQPRTNGALCCSGIISEACASPAAPPPACHGRTHRAAAKLCSSFCSDTSYFFTTEQVSINSRQEFGPFLLVGLLKKSRNPGEGPSHPAQPLSRRRPGHPPENTDCDLSDVCFSRHICHREGCAGRDSPAQTVPSSPLLSHSTPQTGGCRHGGDSESAFIFSILSEGERISARLRGDH